MPRIQTAAQLLVVIPAFNEHASIDALLDGVSETDGAIPLLVCDGSWDGTAQIAQNRGIKALKLTSNLGAWTATQCGLRYAIRENIPFVVTMDADGQHRPEDIKRLLQPLINGEADVVLGSCTSRGSPLRHLAWRLIRTASGLGYDDLTSGFRAMNAKAAQLLCSRCATNLDYQDVGVLLMLEAAGCRLLEVPVNMLPRTSGKSRIFHNWLVVLRYMTETLILGLTKRNIERQRVTPN